MRAIIQLKTSFGKRLKVQMAKKRGKVSNVFIILQKGNVSALLLNWVQHREYLIVKRGKRKFEFLKLNLAQKLCKFYNVRFHDHLSSNYSWLISTLWRFKDCQFWFSMCKIDETFGNKKNFESYDTRDEWAYHSFVLFG